MSQLVTIFGGSGFVGRYIARRLAKEGWRVRVAVRRPNEALFVRTYGAVGQVEPVFCNIRDDASVRAALMGADAAVNCVGVLVREGRNTAAAVHAEGAARVARISKDLGLKRLVQISALGANAASDSVYSRTKAEGERDVMRAFSEAVVLRPSIIFGPEDSFFNRFAAMSRLGPILPVVGADTKFQPVYVDDVAQAAVAGVLGRAKPGIYELGGPEVMTFRELMGVMLKQINRRRLVLNIPFWIARIMGGVLDFVQVATGGLLTNRMLTRDQARNLAHDVVVAKGAKGFDTLGISPTPMASVLPDYLWRFRPSGQYDAIKASAKNLRT